MYPNIELTLYMGCISTGSIETERWCHLPRVMTLPRVLECWLAEVEPIVSCNSDVSLATRRDGESRNYHVCKRDIIILCMYSLTII